MSKLTVALCSVHLRYVEKWLRYFEIFRDAHAANILKLRPSTRRCPAMPSDAKRRSASLPPRDPSVCGRLAVQHLQRAPSLHPSKWHVAQAVSKNTSSWQKIVVFLFIYSCIYLFILYLFIYLFLFIYILNILHISYKYHVILKCLYKYIDLKKLANLYHFTTWHQCITSKSWHELNWHWHPWHVRGKVGLSCLAVRFVLFVLCPAHQNHQSHSGTGVSSRVCVPKQHKSVGKSTCLKTKPMLCYQCYHELSQTMMNFRISRQYCCVLWECTSKAELSRHSKCDCIAVKAYSTGVSVYRCISSASSIAGSTAQIVSSSCHLRPSLLPILWSSESVLGRHRHDGTTPSRRRRHAVTVSFQPRFHPSRSWMPRT